MSKPRIFISADGIELSEPRKAVVDALHSLGYDADWQDISETEQGDLRPMLQRRIRGCRGVIQIVGQRYGGEPPTSDPELGRASYTQYEALFAKSIGKPIWQFVIDDDFPYPELPEESEESQNLQTKYRTQVTDSEAGLFHHCATTDTLALGVLGIQGELKSLRRNFRRWAVGLSAILLLTLALVAWIASRNRDVADELEQVSTKMDTAAGAAIQTRESAIEGSEVITKLSTQTDTESARLRVEAAIGAADRTMRGQVEAIEQLVAEGYSYANANLDGIALVGAKLPGASFAKSTLRDCLLDKLELPGGKLSGADFSFASIAGANFKGAEAERTYFEYSNAKGAVFEGANLAGSSFFHSDLSGANFRNANLEGACLAYCDLSQADFTGAILTDSTLISSILDGADLTDTTTENTDVASAVAKNLTAKRKQFLGFVVSDRVARITIEIWGENENGKPAPRRTRYKAFDDEDSIKNAKQSWSNTLQTKQKENEYIGAMKWGAEIQSFKVFPNKFWETPGRSQRIRGGISSHGRRIIDRLAEGDVITLEAEGFEGPVARQITDQDLGRAWQVKGLPGKITRLAWSGDSLHLAASHEDGSVSVCRVTPGAKPKIFAAHEGSAYGIAWDPDSARLASGGADGTVKIWTPAKSDQATVLKQGLQDVYSLDWSRDGKSILVGEGRATKLVNIETKESTNDRLEGMLDDRVLAARWSPSGEFFAATSSKGHLGIRALGEHDKPLRVVANAHAGIVFDVHWSPDGKRLATGSSDRVIRLWESDTLSDPVVLTGHGGVVNDVSWHPDGRSLVSVAEDKTIVFWDLEAIPKTSALNLEDGVGFRAEWSPDGKHLAVAMKSNVIRIWSR